MEHDFKGQIPNVLSCHQMDNIKPLYYNLVLKYK